MVQLADFGPFYAETNLEHFPVEPFNTYSNFLFLVVALFWLGRIKKQTNPQFKTFLKLSLPLLLVGFIGGSVYHATRSHLGWMLLDVVPIYILGVFAGVYQWRQLNLRLFTIILVFIFLLGVPLTLLWTLVPEGPNKPTLGYTLLTLPVLLPLVFDQFQFRGKYLPLLMRPIALVALALCFRALDSTVWVQQNLSIGTHWLWHCFGAATCHFLLVYMETRSQHLV